MSENRICMSDTHAVGASRISEAVLGPPPGYDDICRFIAEYSGRLPRNAFVGTAPYEYSGCDYALILYAIMPSKCIDLSRLCWSTTPLPAQLEANIAVFCEAARGLQLSDAPTSLLHPYHLRSTPSCIVHHIRVQHWLLVLSQRFVPDKGFDAATLRMTLRHAQLGEPYLTFPVKAATVSSPSPSPLLSSSSSSVGVSTMEALLFRPLHCLTLWRVAGIEPKPSRSALLETTGAKTGALDGNGEAQQVSSKTYPRPWRTAVVATTVKPATASRPGRKAQSVPQSTGSTTPTVSTSKESLAVQWGELEGRRLKLKRTLAHARHTAQSMQFEVGTIDFDAILTILHQRCA